MEAVPDDGNRKEVLAGAGASEFNNGGDGSEKKKEKGKEVVLDDGSGNVIGSGQQALRHDDRGRVLSGPDSEGWHKVPSKRRKVAALGGSSSGGRLGRERRCFRCLGAGHWRRECRDPVVCWRCKRAGHRAATCHLSHMGPESNHPPPIASSRPSYIPSIRLPISRLVEAAAAHLSECIIAKARGHSSSPAVVKEVATLLWGPRACSQVRRVGADTFLIGVPSARIREDMLLAGCMYGGGSSFSLSAWSPVLGAAPVAPRLWTVRFSGLPLHWMEAGCVTQLAERYGRLIDITKVDMDVEGLFFKEMVIEAAEVPASGRIRVSIGHETFDILSTVQESGAGRHRSWADVARPGGSRSRPSSSPVAASDPGKGGSDSSSETTQARCDGMGSVQNVGPEKTDQVMETGKPAEAWEVTYQAGPTVEVGLACAESPSVVPLAREELLSESNSVPVRQSQGTATAREESPKSQQPFCEFGSISKILAGNFKSGGRTVMVQPVSGATRPEPAEPIYGPPVRIPVGLSEEVFFGPGSIGPDWSWTWWDRDPNAGEDIFRPVRDVFPSVPISTREETGQSGVDKVVTMETAVSPRVTKEGPHLMKDREEMVWSRAHRVGIRLNSSADQQRFCDFLRETFGKRGAFDEGTSVVLGTSAASVLVEEVDRPANGPC
ncbi:hypothetical protein QJS10_CPA06g00398 [Acorus calamus]|uniref:CCHC-type domain-containing protein n=1 Tax=Acorus calamus TaxID=4465 RepID=A0AAV9EHU1_ACOCL|nr:hypothetical protein QJS10_CPA06g00398 [Acorus calamus]